MRMMKYLFICSSVDSAEKEEVGLEVHQLNNISSTKFFSLGSLSFKTSLFKLFFQKGLLTKIFVSICCSNENCPNLNKQWKLILEVFTTDITLTLSLTLT
jgi:hypothetical protein